MRNAQIIEIASVAIVLAIALAACGGTPSPAPPTAIPATNTPASVPTVEIPTLPPTSTQTNTPTQASPTIGPTTSPTDTIGPAQICASLIGQKPNGLYVVSLAPIPALAWDQTPRQFQVGVCNTLSVPTVATSQFTIHIFIPGTNQSPGQTAELAAQLNPGLTELNISSWTPGLQNHISACVLRPMVDIEVGYSDSTESKTFRPIPWPDGKTRMAFPVQCGGNFP